MTIFDDYVDIDKIEEVIPDIEYNPESMLGAYIATVSGLSKADLMTATLLYVGFEQREIAEYRGVSDNAVNKQINRAIRKIY